MPYLSALEMCSRQGAIQIHVYLYLYLKYLYQSDGDASDWLLQQQLNGPAFSVLSVSVLQTGRPRAISLHASTVRIAICRSEIRWTRRPEGGWYEIRRFSLQQNKFCTQTNSLTKAKVKAKASDSYIARLTGTKPAQPRFTIIGSGSWSARVNGAAALMRPSIACANEQLDPRQQLANTPPPQSTTPGFHPVSIHQMAPPQRASNPIAAYYSFIDPGRIKGWVGLVGWPVADGLPT